MKVGVMMTAYNAASFIREALESVLRQRSNAVGFDIVVVNDGSTDGTGDIVRAIGAPEIRLIETPNQGVTRARNVALDNMADDIDLFTSLDADDLSPAGRFERDVRHFESDPLLDLTYGYALLFRQAMFDRLAPTADGPTMRVRGVTIGSGLYRYEFVQSVGRFNESLALAEDLDLILRMLEAGPRMKLLDDVCLFVRRHGTNTTHDLDGLRRNVMHALVLSSKRRKGTEFAVPAGLFDLDAMRHKQPF